MADKLALLRSLARRAITPVSDPIPLHATDPETGDDVDVSDGGKYFIKFQDPGGAVKDQIFSALQRVEVETETERRGKEIKQTERATRTVEIMPVLRAAVRGGVIVDACLPVEQAGGTIQGWMWREAAAENLEKLEGFPYVMLGWIMRKLWDFLEETEEVVEDAGEAPTPSENILEEVTTPTT